MWGISALIKHLKIQGLILDVNSYYSVRKLDVRTDAYVKRQLIFEYDFIKQYLQYQQSFYAWVIILFSIKW